MLATASRSLAAALTQRLAAGAAPLAQHAASFSAAAAGETPASLGYHMPGEFEPHTGCWMGWPDDPCLWRDNAKPAQQQYAAVAKTISQFEPVTMFANKESAPLAREYFRFSSGVTVKELPINDGWLRDWGPTCIVKDDPKTGKREVAGVHWDYDCYGAPGKIKGGRAPMMPSWDKDNKAGRTILDMHGLRAFECPLHLEGGSIHADGDGTLVVTSECLLDPSRNPHLGKEGIEKMLQDYLGVKKVLWLWRGMVGDDHVVNGHVDNMACFSAPGTILMSWCDDEMDPQFEVCQKNLEILEQETDAKGRRLQVIKVPSPSPGMFRTFKEANGVHPEHIKRGYVPREAGQRLAGSYINHYVANGGVIVPQFGGKQSKSDLEALEVLQKAYPDRKIVPVLNTREVLLNAGNVHCITQQHVAPRP